ncbi:hypothetical protein SAMN02745243_02955 [Hespellia stercorisuis DSM 15480]|uniref:Uncharacterized protein n=1 Tax=Hespellia stercorisuis DSM 15480 TaxID=1121950 RepID=A0A1M6SHJ6_9FIRM|nr:hypothetical protein SAMN02745243_02955 [Hespellia stercorisuis DSM 15480]
MNKEHTQESCGHQKECSTCTSVTSHYAAVSVPLKLHPYATVGELEMECCGEPVITLRPSQGTNSSCGCELTVTQTICVRIPLEYGTTADVGETSAICKSKPNCGGASHKQSQ